MYSWRDFALDWFVSAVDSPMGTAAQPEDWGVVKPIFFRLGFSTLSVVISFAAQTKSQELCNHSPEIDIINK